MIRPLRQFGNRRDESNVIALCRELSTLLAAGIPLLQSLDGIARQHRGRFRRTVLLLREEVAGGAGLAEAMRDQPRVFDVLATSIVAVGERAGTLDNVLLQIAVFKGRAHLLRGRLLTALIYPAIVLTAGLGVTLFLMTFVVPQLLETLVEAGQDLPLATRLVKSGSDLLVHWWWMLIMGGVGFLVAAALVTQNPSLSRMWHRTQLKMPLFGDLIRKQTIVRIAMTMAALTRSGVAFIEALQIVRPAVQNLTIRDALERAEHAVSAGRDIGPAMESTGVFPSTVVQIVDIGQSSGRLDVMLERLAEDYDAQVQTATQRLLAVLEPAAILLLATLIGFVVLSVILPYLEAGNVL